MRKAANFSHEEHLAAAKAINHLLADALDLHRSLRDKLTIKELDKWLGKLVQSGAGPNALRCHLDDVWFRDGNDLPSPYYPVRKSDR